MALGKRPSSTDTQTATAQAPTTATAAAETPAQTTATAPKRLGGTRKAGGKPVAHLSKEEYWDRKELRDIQRDKDMAWSGLAQAALQSPYIGQLNADNSVDGLVGLVGQVVTKLLAKRNEG
jgi:hypothetical protein